MCGELKIGHGDIERLMFTTFLSEDGTTLQLHESSLPLLLSFIRFRQHMLEVVYYHRTVRAFELMVERTLPEVMKHLLPVDPREDLRRYLDLDECRLFVCVRTPGYLDEESRVIWDRVCKRDLDWKQVREGKKSLHRLEDIKPHLTAEELSNRLQASTELVLGKDYLVDAPSVETPGNVFSFGSGARDRLVIYRGEGRSETKTVDQLAWAGLLPIKLLQYRLYAHKGLPSASVRKLKEAFEVNLGITPSIESELESSF